MGKEQFSYRITKNGNVFVYWQATQTRDRPQRSASQKAHQRIASDGSQTTTRARPGHFKRGNERPVY